MSQPIVIVDYGMGNLRSVQKALERVGRDAVISADPNRVAEAGKIILPGVGAFRDAITRINESVTVEMVVQRTKCCTCSKQVFLDSEANHRDPKNLGVVVTEAGRAKFAEAGIGDPAAHYQGKTIRVRGVVIRREERPYIEVNDPSQIELVEKST